MLMELEKTCLMCSYFSHFTNWSINYATKEIGWHNSFFLRNDIYKSKLQKSSLPELFYLIHKIAFKYKIENMN